MQLSGRKKRRAVFLDRDGVINEEVNYAYRPDQLALIPHAAEAIRLLNDNQFVVIVITNQAGIARGLYTEDDMRQFDSELQELLKKEKNARLDDMYWCPHHPDAVEDKYRITCDCRKPSCGMIVKASKDHGIDLGKSFVVGDKWSDVEAGDNAGCKTILVATGYGAKEFTERDDRNANHYAADLFEAVQIILREG